jgi:two-component system phosphate regulon sensor histidine kinase PhoR
VRIALLIGLAVVVPCVLLVLYGIEAWRIEQEEAHERLTRRLRETLERDVVARVAERLDAAVREAALPVPGVDPADPRCASYLRKLEGPGGPFRAVYTVTRRHGRILDSGGRILRAQRDDPVVDADPSASAALTARIRAGEASVDEARAFAERHPIGIDRGDLDDYPVTLGYLDWRATKLANAESPDAPSAWLDLMEALIRHAPLVSDLSWFHRRAEALRGRIGESAEVAVGLARLRRRARHVAEIAARIGPRREEFLVRGPGHEVIETPESGREILLRTPVTGSDGEAAFLLVLVLDRERFERDALGPALTGIALPGGFRAVRRATDGASPGSLEVVSSRLARPLEDVEVAIVAEGNDAVAAAARPGGHRNVVILVLAIVGAAAAGWLTLRTVTGELRLAKRTSDFVSSVTHELKTPLTAIRMFVETLQEGRVSDDSERRECLDVIARETDRLEERIERVLKLARLGAGRPSFDLHPGSLTGVLRQAADTCRARLVGIPGAQLIEEIDEGLGPVNLDRRAMGEAVANLLANAVKYSPPSRCRLAITGRKNGDEVIVEVRDAGIGIPASEHERIFERFYRVDEPRVREVDGTGLGLALVRKIVEAHGGRIGLTSMVNEGSTFRIHLPVIEGLTA